MTKSSDKSKFKKSYAVPCLYTTFKFCLPNEIREIFQKVVLAVEHNKNLGIDYSIQKLMPKFSNEAANQKVNNNSGNVTLNKDNKRQLRQGSSSQFQLHQKLLQNCITKPNNKQTQSDRIASESQEISKYLVWVMDK